MKSNGKILGVCGGMGPAASAEFMRLLAAMAPAKADQDHPVVYLYSNPQIPDRTEAILRDGISPEPHLREGLMTLCRWGAQLLAVPCNTAHCFIDRFRGELPVPLIHIVEATLDDARAQSPEGSWILATGGTLHSGIFDGEAQRRNYRLYRPDEATMEKLTAAIAKVKAGEIDGAAKIIKAVAMDLWSRRDLPLMCACTELPLAYDASGLPQDRAVSSLKSLAAACLDQLYR